MLSAFRAGERAAFVPYVVAGYPTMDLCERVVDALVEAGADLLELGVPFSDALADGPTIQAASEAASRTVQLADVLDLAARVHARHPGVPLVLFTYVNPVLHVGLRAFARRARAAGVAAVLVVDLPPEEAADYRAALDEAGLRTVFLASPTTSPARLAQIAAASTGFLYYVARTGVTGAREELSTSLAGELAEVRRQTGRPVAVGFGISTGEQARAVATLGEAVVVGSALVRLVDPAVSPEVVLARVRALAGELVAGIRAAGEG